LQSLTIDGLNVLVKREPDGSMYAINLLPTGGTEEPIVKQPEPSEEESRTPLLFKQVVKNASVTYAA
jgi:hypothetical protein